MAETDRPPVAMSGDEEYRATERTRRSSPIGRLVPWFLAVCLLGFCVLAAIAAFQALRGSSVLTRATPTPAFLAGTEVKLVGQDGGSVTVWHVAGNCDLANALGQLPAASDAYIQDGACYNREGRTTYYQIMVGQETTGWVAAGDLVPAAEYTPPFPTETPEPRPTPTFPPTQTPAPAPLPVGSPLSVGSWAVRVDRVEVARSLSSPAGDKMVEATGRYALVFLTVTNRGFRAATLHASSVYIEDAGGIRYRNDDLASAYASSGGCLDFALEVGPDESRCLVAAVDISAQSSFYILSLDGAGEAVLLDLR